MFESVIGLTKGIVMLSKSFPTLMKVKNNPELYDDFFTYNIMKGFSKATLDSVGQKINVYGLENIPKENSLFVGNHKSMMDGLIMPAVLENPISMIIAKEPLHENLPIATDWMKINRCLFIDRKNNREAIKTINEAVNIIKDYRSVGAFPEGHITPEGKIVDDFKDGLFKIAIKAKCPIVPMVIVGSENSYEYRKNFLPKIKKATIDVYILEPVVEHLESLNKINTKDLSDTVKSLILNKLYELKKDYLK